MNCPACGGELARGAALCPACETPVAPRVEGALAPDPRMVTPPSRGRVRPDSGPRRDGADSERSWRDEVRERVRSRRERRAEVGLPLFESVGEAPLARPAEPSAADAAADVGEIELSKPVAAEPAWRPAARVEAPPPSTRRRSIEPLPTPSRVVPLTPPELAVQADLFSPGLSEEELADLPLRTAVPAAPAPAPEVEVAPPQAPPSEAGTQREAEAFAELDRELERGRHDQPATSTELAPEPQASPVDEEPATREATIETRPDSPPDAASLDDEIVLDDGAEPDLELELAPPAVEPSPVERPARPLERAQAAAFDAAVFVALGSIVIYFAGRAARVEALSLAGVWPWVGSFLGLLAVFYAGYFTGTTGQTPGKLLTGLQVVDRSGRPPRYPRAAARGLAGLFGIAAAGAGLLPILFDPARRALHDRVFRTRVVRR